MKSFVLIALLLSAAGMATPPAVGAASTQAPDPALDAYILQRMAEARLPGLSAAIVRGDELLWLGSYGDSRVRPRRPVTPATLFTLASISKTFIATSVMQLVEIGLLDLDADINDILPFEVRNPFGEPGETITTRMLLSHVGGIRDNGKVLSQVVSQGDSPIPLGPFLEGYLVEGGEWYDADRNYAHSGAGAHYLYSNFGAALAAYVVEVVSGVPFDAWTESMIFEPLAMHNTAWHLADLDQRDIAMPYRWVERPGSYVPLGFTGYPDYPDGSLRTSAPQLARFLMAYINGGTWKGRRILSPGSVEAIFALQFTDVIRIPQGLSWYYAVSGGETTLGHGGGDRGIGTSMFFKPSSDIGVIILANASDADGALRDIERRLFGKGEELAAQR